MSKQKIIYVQNIYWTGKSMNNLLSYCGLVDARISASEKDLPEHIEFLYMEFSIN